MNNKLKLNKVGTVIKLTTLKPNKIKWNDKNNIK